MQNIKDGTIVQKMKLYKPVFKPFQQKVFFKIIENEENDLLMLLEDEAFREL